MTAPAIPVRLNDDFHRRGRLTAALADIAAVTGRNLIAYRRVPLLVVFSTVQPVVFVLLFRYVFGGAIRDVPGGSYVDYLMPGIFAQTVVFGAIGTAVGLATDLNLGLIERFRSVPMARSAVLAGRTTADMMRNLFVVVLMFAVGLLIGFRVHTNVLGAVAGMLLVVLFGYAFSWIFAAVGMAVRDAETAQAASFPVMAPLVFASTAFVPLTTMPGWLQPFAEHQPVSVTVDAVRALVGGGATVRPVLKALAWILGILVVSAPLAVRRYRRTA
ncbi:MAG TPA: ABC transporter permease [Acidimicrobiales bacterium]|nr:ABC transporter permease [Acidimicrobiales bacterium]